MTVPAPTTRSIHHSGRRPIALVCMFGLAALTFCSSGCRTTPVPMEQNDTLAVPVVTNAPLAKAGVPLTFESAAARAIALNREIAVLRGVTRVAQLRIRAARDWSDPEVRVSYSEDSTDSSRFRWDHSTLDGAAVPADVGSGAPPAGMAPSGRTLGSGSDEGDAYRVALRVYPPNPWTRSAQVSRESAAYYATVEEVRAAEWALAVDVRRIFAELAYLEKDLTEVQTLADLRKTLCEAVRQRADQGLATLEDMADASRRYLNILTNLASARQQRDQVRGRLALLVDIPTDTLIVDTASLTESDTAFIKSNFAQLEEKALASSAIVSARAWQVKATRSEYRGTQARRIPWFNHIQADYTASSESSRSHSYNIGSSALSALTATEYDITEDDNDGTEWGVSAAISLPVFSWFSDTPALVRAEIALAEERLDAAREEAKSKANHALNLAITLRNNRKLHAETVAPATRELEALLAQADTPTSPIDPDRALRIREELVESRRTALEMDHDYRAALIDLEEALGLGFSIRANE